MVEVQLTNVRVDLQTNTPVVLLQELEGARHTLPIFIAAPEATAIAFAHQGVVTERPVTHDLMRDILGELGVTVERVVVTELQQSTYFVELHLRPCYLTGQLPRRRRSRSNEIGGSTHARGGLS